MADELVKNGGDVRDDDAPSVVFRSVKAQLFIEAPKARDAIDFYMKAFDADEVARNLYAKRKSHHDFPLIRAAQIQFAGSTFIVSDYVDEAGEPLMNEDNGYVFYLETDDVDAAVAQAERAGARSKGDVLEGKSALRGVRVCKVVDPYGFVWCICSSKKTHTEAEAEAEAKMVEA